LLQPFTHSTIDVHCLSRELILTNLTRIKSTSEKLDAFIFVKLTKCIVYSFFLLNRVYFSITNNIKSKQKHKVKTILVFFMHVTMLTIISAYTYGILTLYFECIKMTISPNWFFLPEVIVD